jgi:transposase
MGQESSLTTYKQYPAEFRADAVALARASDKPMAQVARDLGVNHETLRLWVKAAVRAEDPALASGDAKDAEIARLRKQVRELETEREILRKAAAYFARETNW